MTAGRGRFEGALLGLALGEALGLPHVGAAPGTLGRPERFSQPAGRLPLGQYGAGTQAALEVTRSLVERRGFDGGDVAERLAALYREGRIIGRTEKDREAVNRLLVGSADWKTSGAPVGRVSVAPALRAIPVGLWRGEDARRLFDDASALARVTHKDPRAVAAAVGAAGAAAYLVTVDRVDPDRFLRHLAALVRPADEATATALEELGHWAADREDLKALAQASACLGKGSPRPDQGEGVQGAQVLLAALVAFLRKNGDYLGCIGTALKAGGETDHSAGLAGALAGAYTGVSGLPRLLADGVSDRGENGREEILALAARLHELRAAEG